jgi:hypothetical protein
MKTKKKARKQVARRAGYYHPPFVPEKMPSVTTVLGILAKPALIYWAAKTAAEAALDDPTLSVAQACAAIYKKRDTAGDLGSDIHRMIDRQEYDMDKVEGVAKGYIEAYEKFRKQIPHKIILKEQIVYSEKHKYAGSFDALIETKDKKIILVDYKTSKSVYPEYAIQLEAYRSAILEMGMAKRIDSCAILHLKPDGTYSFIEMKGDLEVFLSCKLIFARMKE